MDQTLLPNASMFKKVMHVGILTKFNISQPCCLTLYFTLLPTFENITLDLPGWKWRHGGVRQLDLVIRLLRSRTASGGQLLQRVVVRLQLRSLVDGDLKATSIVQFYAVQRRRRILGNGFHQRVDVAVPIGRGGFDAETGTDGSLAEGTAVVVTGNPHEWVLVVDQLAERLFGPAKNIIFINLSVGIDTE